MEQGMKTGTTQDSPGESSGALGAVQEAAGQAQEAVVEKTQEVVHRAGDAARTRVQDQADQRSTDVGKRIGDVASAIGMTGDKLREQGQAAPADALDQIATRTQSIGDYLVDGDADRFVRDFNAFGRRNPWAVAAGALALGFFAARVMKASASVAEGGPGTEGDSQQIRARSSNYMLASGSTNGHDTGAKARV